MPRIEANFAEISENIGPLPSAPYRCVIKEITNDKVGQPPKDRINIKMEVDDPSKPEFAGRELYDRIILQKNDGQPNKMSYGKIKQYAIATLGKEAAQDPNGYDTDAFLNGTVVANVVLENYDYIPPEFQQLPADQQEQHRKKGTSNKIDRVVPA